MYSINMFTAMAVLCQRQRDTLIIKKDICERMQCTTVLFSFVCLFAMLFLFGLTFSSVMHDVFKASTLSS